LTAGTLIVAAALETNDTNIPAVGTGFTSIIGSSDAAGDAARIEWKVAGSAGADSATWTYTGVAADAWMSIMAFKVAGAAPPPPPKRLTRRRPAIVRH
jgi:hypothetical protein